MERNPDASSLERLSDNEFLLKNVNSTVIELISGQQAIEELRKKDDFINSFSSFDLESRLHSTSVTVEDYFQLIEKHILPWDKASRRSIISCIENVNTKCINQVKLLTFPSRIYIVLTDGKDESNAAYCRNENVIVFPKLMISTGQIRAIFIHELFHIWSKWHTNLAMRDAIYASIGYYKIPVDQTIEFPNSLSSIKMTNPDAPLVMKYYINLKKEDDPTEKIYKCTPILHAARDFDVNFSTNFFRYMVPTTLILDDDTYQPLQPLQYLPYDEASNFFEQIGDNTHYVIHPEEISAENFVLWMTSVGNLKNVSTPAIINNMNDIISHAANNA